MGRMAKGMLTADNYVPAPQVGWLVPLNGPQKGQVFRLTQSTTIIGSGETAQVRLEDEHVEPEHCRIHATHWGYELVSNSFPPKNYVHGHPVGKYQLDDGLVFVVGKTQVIIKTL